jgi:hypothetical protein
VGTVDAGRSGEAEKQLGGDAWLTAAPTPSEGGRRRGDKLATSAVIEGAVVSSEWWGSFDSPVGKRHHDSKLHTVWSSGA